MSCGIYPQFLYVFPKILATFKKISKNFCITANNNKEPKIFGQNLIFNSLKF